MERRKFTREFKLEAVRLIKDRGVSYVQASQINVRKLLSIRRRPHMTPVVFGSIHATCLSALTLTA
jgi:hypothetical protein